MARSDQYQTTGFSVKHHATTTNPLVGSCGGLCLGMPLAAPLSLRELRHICVGPAQRVLLYGPLRRQYAGQRQLQVSAAVLPCGNACLLQGGTCGQQRAGDWLDFGWNGKVHCPECLRVKALDSRVFISGLSLYLLHFDSPLQSVPSSSPDLRLQAAHLPHWSQQDFGTCKKKKAVMSTPALQDLSTTTAPQAQETDNATTNAAAATATNINP
ncbi:hypothetical protein BC826DRAFT_973488 [Russula brevipes]|nr:hypothetical protein BC826DRAFT_973488 [Russula brevipes]